jgi:hypothetical protein
MALLKKIVQEDGTRFVEHRDPLMEAGSLKNMGSNWMAALPFLVNEL